MEYYDWQNNASRKSVIAIHNFGQDKIEESLIPNIVSYSEAVSNIMNHGKVFFVIDNLLCIDDNLIAINCFRGKWCINIKIQRGSKKDV